MLVDKARIIRVLRSRGMHDRAAWVDREFPRVVDTRKDRSLLRMLHLDPTALEQAES